MVIGLTNLGFWAIKCLKIRHMGLVCIRVTFGLGLFFESLSCSTIIGVSSAIGPW